MTYRIRHLTIHTIDDDPVCTRTLCRWVKSIPLTPPALTWAGLFGA